MPIHRSPIGTLPGQSLENVPRSGSSSCSYVRLQDQTSKRIHFTLLAVLGASRGGDREAKMGDGCRFGSSIALVNDTNTLTLIWEPFAFQVGNEIEECSSV